ncbi:MFS transporter [Gordonia westfalica]|uniref:MFS transporter n=1 Tax=Gordonia westfalica TaxID=158898 RepID=A0ABU2GUC7_9ACTN|nr:MFS transporter [Gordonia westfalica]MDS1115057.1 MFS transporter [Gordonia westfalica]
MALSTTATPSLSRRSVLLMALVSGLVVANSYYAQPIVALIANDLDASTTSVGLVVTASQVGYAIGLALLVPLGDLLDRRKLLWAMLFGTGACLAIMACAPSWQILASAAVLVGTGSVVGQLLVPLAATLAADAERGRVIGNVMTGLLLGILLSRVAAGLIAEVAGWRTVFLTAAVLMAVAGIAVAALPTSPPTTELTYGALLRSVVRLVADESVLRWRIGSGLMLGATAASFLLLAAGERSIVAMGLGLALLDLGIQGTHITNQSVFYPLRPDARSRLNTAYMTTYFAAGSVGSILSVLAFASAGWSAVCVLGAAFPVAGVGLWLVETRIRRRDEHRRGASGLRDGADRGLMRP